LFLLVAVAGVAAWALLRPGRNLALVGSLELWRKALDALDRSVRRRSRRVTLSWVLLLIGSTLGVVGLSRPSYRFSAPVRHVVVEVLPGAELAGPGGMEELKSAVGALLDRLDERDRVAVVLPTLAGGSSGWTSRAEARRQVGQLQALPIPAKGMTLQEAPPGARHVYCFAPAGTDLPSGPGRTVIGIPPRLPPVTVEAFGAAALPDGRVEVLVTLRSRSGGAWRGPVTLRAYDEAGQLQNTYAAEASTERPLVQAYPSAAAWVVEAPGGQEAGVGGRAALVRSRTRQKAVAILGADEPKLRQYVRVDPLLRLVADANDADVVIANEVDPPQAKPALAINPPTPPPGWSRADPVGPVLPTEVAPARDDPVMRHVDLSALAIRKVSAWVPAAPLPGIALAARNRQALIVRNDPDASPPESRPPRRVSVAFSLYGENTNLTTLEGFVIFLADALRWLTQGERADGEYGFVSPRQVGADPGWTAVGGAGGSGSWPWPGLYKDSEGGLHAVSVLGLRSAEAKTPPGDAVAGAPLPPAESAAVSREFWPWLVVAAAALCLAGWAARLR